MNTNYGNYGDLSRFNDLEDKIFLEFMVSQDKYFKPIMDVEPLEQIKDNI